MIIVKVHYGDEQEFAALLVILWGYFWLYTNCCSNELLLSAQNQIHRNYINFSFKIKAPVVSLWMISLDEYFI